MIARGTVVNVRSGAVDLSIAPLAAGTNVRIACRGGWKHGSITSAANGIATATLSGNADGIVSGAYAEEGAAETIVLGTAALGRAIDACGQPLDGDAPLCGVRIRFAMPRIAPSERIALDAPMWTGVRAIDALLTIGRGARVGLFGAPGAGKSTLLETIAGGTCADAIVVALVGERGREAEQWIARRDQRTTVVCATSDRPARERVAAARAAFAHARALARRGLHVLLILDSLARVAYALREDRAGEPAGRGGYPPSVFADLAQFVESAGAFTRGSVSLLATVLSDGDERDPVSEAARSLLDGHIELSQELAHAGRFPAIDLLASASRTMAAVTAPEHQRAAARIRAAFAALAASEDLRSVGIEPRDPEAIAAIAHERRLEALVRQERAPVHPRHSLAMLLETADTLGEPDEHRF
ncbi:MAG: ATP-binding cassette domain-containing protein [Candidatus Eremiobacteraeota bacterium]|nr:ATP-binding cassette domain-containing protein [Candidatus Eremiobacteraeota bacterium]